MGDRPSFSTLSLSVLCAVGCITGTGAASAAPKTESAKMARDAIELLAQTPRGKKILLRAQAFWKETSREGILKHLAYGPVSRTDAVLTRHYHADTGAEIRERYVTVILKKDQSLADVTMDLGHELVHATTPPSWDPYDPKLTAGSYMYAAIEADGGEVDAVLAECEIAVDLKRDLDIRTSRCDRYLILVGGDNQLSVDRVKIQADFYRVGKWEAFVRTRLGKELERFPLLSPKIPELYSATGGAPYPVSLMREYEELNRVACENVRRRSGRSPASVAQIQAEPSLGDRCSGMSFSSRASD